MGWDGTGGAFLWGSVRRVCQERTRIDSHHSTTIGDFLCMSKSITSSNFSTPIS
jgi:hypothetical protein